MDAAEIGAKKTLPIKCAKMSPGYLSNVSSTSIASDGNESYVANRNGILPPPYPSPIYGNQQPYDQYAMNMNIPSTPNSFSFW